MGIFDNIASTSASRTSNYTRPGRYWCIINRVKEGTTRANDGFVAIEMTTIHRFEEECFPDSSDAKGDPTLGSHKIGEDHTHMMMTKHDSFLGNFKQFVMGVTGAAESEVTPEVAAEIVSDQQPLSGAIVEVWATQILTRAKKPFTKVSYEREVSPAFVKKHLPQDRIERFFPNGMLDRLIEASEATEAA